MRHRISRQRHKEQQELSITAFMNLMVVLVPFLLMSAVFTHLATIELNLPSLSDNQQNDKDKPEFVLQVTIRKSGLILSDSRGGLIRSIDRIDNRYDYQTLTATLKQIKARFPDKTSATILAEQYTDYNTLVQVMDSVRTYAAFVDGNVVQAELFPDISIGDAPQ